MSVASSEANKASLFRCADCDKGFSERRNLRKHLILKHHQGKNGFSCVLCDEKITNIDVYIHHLNDTHGKVIEREELVFKDITGKFG